MNKRELLSLCGSIEQVAGVRRAEYQDGRASALRCALVKSGPLEYALMLDKCLDPAWITYRGVNLSVLTKPGLQGRNPYDTAGAEAVRSVMGGAMFTCGLDNVHGNRQVDGVEYPVHGRMRTTPAEKVGMDAWFDGDDYRIQVRGEMRQGKIFGENMVLRRTVETVYGSRTIRIRDEIENQGFAPEPLCFLYHCNAGYPLLAPGTRVLLPDKSCTPRDSDAERGMEQRFVMGAPRAGEPEQVFQHVLAADENGNTFGAFVNDELGLGLCIRWNVRQIPFMTQWKSAAAGDYAAALEPTNVGFAGRGGQVQSLEPFETRVNELSFTVIEGRDEIRGLEQERMSLMDR